jgi:hypothetical protein
VDNAESSAGNGGGRGARRRRRATEAAGRPLRRPNRSTAVYLHIGTVKSGTTYIQSVLRTNSTALRDAGLRMPESRQVQAVREVLSMQRSHGPHTVDAWDTLVRKCLSTRGRGAIVSMEFLSFADDEQAKRIVDSFAGAEVHVILTARDLARILPSAWQNAVKSGRQWSYERYLGSITGNSPGADDSPERHFWSRHDVAAICRRWVPLVDPGHFHLVTVPPAGAPADALWTRFAQVLDVDPTAFDLTAVGRSNPSLSMVEAELMLRVTAAMEGRRRNVRVLRGMFANKLVRGGGGPKVVLPADAYEFAVSRTQRVLSELAELDLHVVGSVDDLVPGPPAPGSPATAADAMTHVTDDELAGSAVRSAAALVEDIVRRVGSDGAGLISDDEQESV